RGATKDIILVRKPNSSLTAVTTQARERKSKMSEELKQQREEQGVIVPITKATMLASASPVSTYLAAHGVGMNGTYFKFGKDGKFVKASDDEEIPEGTEFVVIYDQVQGGWVKFMGKGNPPERKQGPLFAGFVPPPREELGDTDQSEWEEGLSGKPADPW